MTRLGQQDGAPLVVDLTGQQIDSWSDLWDALARPCGLPQWFGRNLDAWWDTIQTGAISETIDSHSRLVVRLVRQGFFRPGGDGEPFIEVTNECEYVEVDLVEA